MHYAESSSFQRFSQLLVASETWRRQFGCHWSFVSDGGNHSSFIIFTVCFFGMKPNIDNKGRAARGGIAAIFILAGGTLIQETPVLALIFILVVLFCAFEAWQAWCAIRACGFKLPF